MHFIAVLLFIAVVCGTAPGQVLEESFQVYGDPRHYLFVADFNRIDDFRRLTVGQPIVFPPTPQQVEAARR